MELEKRFQKIDGSDAFVSVTYRGSDSPAYLIVRVARTLLQNGREVQLPRGWSKNTLNNFCWDLGAENAARRVNLEMAKELSELGSRLLELNKGSRRALKFLTSDQEASVNYLVGLVPKG